MILVVEAFVHGDDDNFGPCADIVWHSPIITMSCRAFQASGECILTGSRCA